MLVTADWILPISNGPIRSGGVLVDAGRIVAVGPTRELASHELAAERHDFDGCIISPGLVNAHTHLTLTALHGVVPPLRFTEWLPKLVAAMKPWEVADHEASGVLGAEECLASGVTCVGDIAYGAAEVSRASAAGLGGVYYWELLGLDPAAIDSHLDYLRYPQERNAYGPRVVAGLSPHAPYSCSPALLAATDAKARALGVPLAIHVAESAAEVELMHLGTGPLLGVAERNMPGFRPPGTSTVCYLAALGALDDATAVHVCHLEPGDIGLLAQHARGVVTCPRSNAYLHNPVPEIGPLLDADIPVGIGTDSSASNHDLNLMAEVRTLLELQPELGPDAVLRMATLSGARAIGVEDRFGSLEAGKSADLSVFRVREAEVPVPAFVDAAGADTVEAVLAGGVWRVYGGVLLSRDAEAAERAAAARIEALATL
ncbi:MAG TPA: amidohydrolase family protein [Coriobacteriia bacterium]|nr:amidohydrolase family protein [Coriobacteriia bacterium]